MQETAVRDRYTSAAQSREAELCCPVDYDPQYLKIIPDEVIQRDYGCGDPSKHVRAGETVLDLGSGGGKICFIASQIVGETGRVIGVDMNDTMLELARRSSDVVAEKIGYANCEFRKGKIQDLTVDRDLVDAYLNDHPVTNEADLQALERHIESLRLQPMIPDNSIDVVVSNCVLNLVDANQKEHLFRELHRVLKVGGRAVISDIVCDEPVPQSMVDDPELWSGCISGAFLETEYVDAFSRVGFGGIRIADFQTNPWQTVGGIEFRSATVVAYKMDDSACMEHNEAVIYRGPYRSVTDDLGHIYQRGHRTAVCRRSFEMLTGEAFGDDFIGVQPMQPIQAADAKPYDCEVASIRSPKVTKGAKYSLTIASDDCCGGSDCC